MDLRAQCLRDLGAGWHALPDKPEEDLDRTLAHYGEAAKAATPALTVALNRGDNYARYEAATALCAIGPSGQVVAAGALKTKDLTFRRHILSSLKEARCRAKDTVPLIAACLEYDSAPLRSLAAEVLVNVLGE